MVCWPSVPKIANRQTTSGKLSLTKGYRGGAVLQINVVYDASVANAPAGFQQAIQAAVQFFESTISSNVIVTIAFGWGEVGGQAIDPGSIGESRTEYAPYGVGGGYHDLLRLFGTTTDSPAIAAALNMPDRTDTFGGAELQITTAQAKLLGLIDPSGTDGYIGLDSSLAFAFDPANRAVPGAYDAIGVLEHEISEVLGRAITSGLPSDILNLFRYLSPGSPAFGGLSGSGGNFSVNGDQTLAVFNDSSNGGDAGDWGGGGPADAFDAFGTAGAQGSISAADIRALQAIGYQISFLTPGPNGTPIAPLVISQSGGVAQGQSLSFDGQASLLFSPGSSAAGIVYTNAGTISNSGANSKLDVVGIQWAPSAGLGQAVTGEQFFNAAGATLTVQAVAFASAAAGVFFGPDVTNAGHIIVSSAAGDAWGVMDTGFLNTSTGVLTVQASNDATGVDISQLYLVSGSSGSIVISNTGSIQASGNNNATGVAIADGVFTNNQTGVVTVQGVNEAVGVAGGIGTNYSNNAGTLQNPGENPDAGTVQNAGTIQVTGVGAIGVKEAAHLTNTGLIQATAVSGVSGYSGLTGAYGVWARTWGAGPSTVLNSGTITATAGAYGTAEGLFLEGGSFSNTGLISATGQSATGLDDYTYFSTNPLISNAGTITATGAGAIGVSLRNFGGNTFVNSGVIDVTTTAVNAYPYVISIGAGGGLVTIVNSGTIEIDPASAHFYNTNTGVSTYPGAAIGSAYYDTYALNLFNSGTIGAGVYGGTTGHIINTGSMTGVGLTGSGVNLYDGSHGALSGSISVGAVATVYLGNEGEKAAGTSGTMVVFGGTGADTIAGGSGNDLIDGGKGNDTLTGGLGADVFVFAPGDGQDVVTDFSDAQGDKIDLSAYATIAALADVQSHAIQSGADTIITVGADSITLHNVQLSSLTGSDFVFSGAYSPVQVSTAYTVGASQSLTFSGSSGGQGAYKLLGGGSLTIQGSVLVQDGVANDSPIGAYVNVSGGSQPVFHILAGGSLSVAGFGGLSGAAGFEALASAQFINDGDLSVAGAGASTAVLLHAGGSFSNSGTILLSSQSGTLIGVESDAAGSFSNAGTVSVFGHDAAYGFQLSSAVAGGATFTNSGTITVASGGGPAYGVWIQGPASGGPETVNNSGRITAADAIYSQHGVILNNTGTIDGDIHLGSSGDNVYDGSQGGTLTGVLYLGGGANQVHLGNDGETVVGSAGSAVITGGYGADHVTGGSGDDVIDGGQGDDVLDGGGGVNTVSYDDGGSISNPTNAPWGSIPGVTVDLKLQGSAQNIGADGTDTLSNFQNILGSIANDHLIGDANNNVIDGNGGNDVLDGGGGMNTVSFASSKYGAVTVSLALQGQVQDTNHGNDVLSNFQNLVGSPNNDTLEGGGFASTTVTGGAGADTFVYKSGDGAVTVEDFSHAQGDRIDLSTLTSFRSLNDVLARAAQVGSDTVITFAPGSTLRLGGVAMASLTAADFALPPGPTVGPGTGGAPTTGNGTLNGTSGSDWLQGGSGNDTLHGGAGSDYLDGGAGLNTALYDGAYRQYEVGPGGATVGGGPEGGADFLVNIQRIKFADGYLAIAPTDTAGEVYRVYAATLGRAPDQEGLTNWVTQLNSGGSLQGVVNGFVNSPEFLAKYGANLSNSDFVTLLYENVLHREPDPGGLNNWVGFMVGGMTRAQVVLGFSESPEDIKDLAGPVQQGLWIADAAAGEVARLYDTVLGRLPDGSGLANWTHTLEGGATLQSVANGFVGSSEFQNTYGNLNDHDFVTLLYHNVLHRNPDPGGLTNWVNDLAGGTTRAQVVVGFSESPEHIGAMAPYIDSGVWLAG